MDLTRGPALAYRWMVFLLAIFYVVLQVTTGSWATFGGPFRYLTIWALCASCLSAWFMLTISLGQTSRNYHVPAMVAAVLNVMVVVLYWRLYFADPAMVNGDKAVIWYREYYLHAVGPALQIADALFVGRVFQRAQRAVPALLAVIACYVLWSELVLRPLSDTPVGSVTSGLPYPFLNGMQPADRMVYYLTNAGFALAVLLGFAVLGWLLSLAWPRRNAA